MNSKNFIDVLPNNDKSREVSNRYFLENTRVLKNAYADGFFDCKNQMLKVIKEIKEMEEGSNES